MESKLSHDPCDSICDSYAVGAHVNCRQKLARVSLVTLELSALNRTYR